MVKVLDCTLRDGGYVNNWQFDDKFVRDCYIACSNTNIDYMEIGFRNFNTPDLRKKYGDTFFCYEEYLNRVIGDIEGCKVAVMVTINAFDIADFVPKSESKIDMVRVLMAYHGSKNGDDNILDVKQLLDGVKQIEQLIELGYEISFNIGRIDKMSRNQLYEVCNILSKTKISYFTMADTYGSINLKDIEELIPYIKFLLKDVFQTNIQIGFHSHDNMANATSKAVHSLKYGVDMIDGCILGYGRGSGNAKTELILMDLNKTNDNQYDFINVIEIGDNYLINYKECKNNLCYNIVYALAAYYGCHVSYAIDIIEKYEKTDIRKICEFFKHLKEIKKEMFYYDEYLKKEFTLN
jgi:4-hydroxy 2-oxovalerate aldolase